MLQNTPAQSIMAAEGMTQGEYEEAQSWMNNACQANCKWCFNDWRLSCYGPYHLFSKGKGANRISESLNHQPQRKEEIYIYIGFEEREKCTNLNR